MAELRKYNLQIPELLKHFGKVSSSQSASFLYANARAAFIPSLAQGQLQHLLAIIRLAPEAEGPRVENSYPGLILAKESTPYAGFAQDLLGCAQTQRLTIAGFEIEMNPIAQYEFEGSGNAYTGPLPCFVYELASKNSANLSWGDPLLQYGLPPYESVEQALRAWIALKPFHGSSDGRLGKVIIVAPLFGPRLGKLELDSGILRVRIEQASARPEFELKGAWQSSKRDMVENLSHQVATNEVKIPRPNDADQVWLWLIDSHSDLLDAFHENPHHCSRAERVLYPSIQEPVSSGHGTRQAGWLEEIRRGECENVEFKPFIRKGDPKIEEIVRTSIAFANKRGGRIYIGVNDYQEIEGIDRDVFRAYSKDGAQTRDEGAQRYCKFLRKVLSDRSNKSLETEIEPEEIAGKLVVRIAVPEGRDKPYSDVRTKEIWTRAGSNTVRPDPETELRGLLTEESQPQLFRGPGSH